MADNEREGSSAPMDGWVCLGPDAESRADERPDVDGAQQQLGAITDQIEVWLERIDMEGYAPTRDDLEALHEMALDAAGRLGQSWDGESLVRG